MEKRTALINYEISRRAKLDIARRKVSRIKEYKLYLLRHKHVLLKYIMLDCVYRNNNVKPCLETFKNNLIEYKLYNASVLVYNAYRKKRARLKRACIICMSVYNYSYFVTLTFEDLEKRVSLKTVYSWLSLKFDYFVLNEDYGTLNGRVHFHVVIGTNYSRNVFKTIIAEIWGLGFYDIRTINFSDKSLEKISKYITKITGHSCKFTTTSCILSKSLKFINNPRKEEIIYD